MKQPPHSCGRCESRWWGIRMAHCSGCHRTFSAVSTFDRHRATGKCVMPREFVQNEHGVWGTTTRVE